MTHCFQAIGLAIVGQHEVLLKVGEWTGRDPGRQDTRYSSRDKQLVSEEFGASKE